MGALADSVLRADVPSAYAPRPVGAFAARQAATATLVRRRGDGSWEYGEEIPITVTLGRWMETFGPGTLYWSGIEVRYLKEKGAEGFTRFHVVAALTPVRWNWFACAPLRPTYKENPPRIAAIEAALRDGTPLRDLPFDPFEQNRDYRVARLDDPFRLYWEDGAAFEGGYVRGHGPGDVEGASWRFGLCEEAPMPRSDGREARTKYARLPPAATLEREDAIESAALLHAMAGRVGGSGVTFAERLAEVRDELRRPNGRVLG